MSASQFRQNTEALSDFHVSEANTKPSLNYKLINEVLENYEELQNQYKAETEITKTLQQKVTLVACTGQITNFC